MTKAPGSASGGTPWQRRKLSRPDKPVDRPAQKRCKRRIRLPISHRIPIILRIHFTETLVSFPLRIRCTGRTPELADMAIVYPNRRLDFSISRIFVHHGRQPAAIFDEGFL